MPLIGMEFLTPVVGLIVNVAVQIAVYRYLGGVGLLRSVFLGFLLGLIATLAIDTAVFHDSVLPLSYALSLAVMDMMTFGCLGYCYFHFINLGETARRIRIVREIQESREGLSMDEIIARYGARHVVDIRLARLLKKGQIIERSGRYYIGQPSMLIMSRMIVFMKSLLLGRKSEFE